MRHGREQGVCVLVHAPVWAARVAPGACIRAPSVVDLTRYCRPAAFLRLSSTCGAHSSQPDTSADPPPQQTPHHRNPHPHRVLVSAGLRLFCAHLGLRINHWNAVDVMLPVH